MHASDLEPLNILERYAFALACIERLCHHWGVSDEPFIAKMIVVHWGLVGRRILSRTADGTRGDWWRETHEYCPKPGDLQARVHPGLLSADQLRSLHHAFYELRAVPSGDMYCQPETHRSAIHALNVVGILLAWGVALPPVDQFRIEGCRPGTFDYGTRRYTRADFFGRDGEAAEPETTADGGRDPGSS